MALKTAVIGCGHIGQQHLAALVACGDPGKVLACDLSTALAKSSAERFRLQHWSTNFREVLDEFRPDVVHVATPAHTHVVLATQALRAGAHVLVEKPIAPSFGEFKTLIDCARENNRFITEDHNYRFEGPIQKLLRLIDRGDLGQVVHIDIFIALDILGPGSVFTDPNVPHPSTREPGGAVSDFLTHLSYLACQFIGPHRSLHPSWNKLEQHHELPADEFRALVDGERATACIGFSARSQPDTFWLQVHGTKISARANLFESRLTLNKVRAGIRPLTPLLNGFAEGAGVIRSSLRSMTSKIAGAAGSYQGLWNLIEKTHVALEAGEPPPVSIEDMELANQLVADIQATAPPTPGGGQV